MLDSLDPNAPLQTRPKRVDPNQLKFDIAFNPPSKLGLAAIIVLCAVRLVLLWTVPPDLHRPVATLPMGLDAGTLAYVESLADSLDASWSDEAGHEAIAQVLVDDTLLKAGKLADVQELVRTLPKTVKHHQRAVAFARKLATATLVLLIGAALLALFLLRGDRRDEASADGWIGAAALAGLALLPIVLLVFGMNLFYALHLAIPAVFMVLALWDAATYGMRMR